MRSENMLILRICYFEIDPGEKELDAFHRTEAEKKNHILQGLIEHKDIHPDYLAELLPVGEQKNSRYHLIRIY